MNSTPLSSSTLFSEPFMNLSTPPDSPISNPSHCIYVRWPFFATQNLPSFHRRRYLHRHRNHPRAHRPFLQTTDEALFSKSPLRRPHVFTRPFKAPHLLPPGLSPRLQILLRPCTPWSLCPCYFTQSYSTNPQQGATARLKKSSREGDH